MNFKQLEIYKGAKQVLEESDLSHGNDFLKSSSLFKLSKYFSTLIMSLNLLPQSNILLFLSSKISL